MSYGLIFTVQDSWDNEGFLYLPFVPTETNVSSNSSWETIAPPGMSGNFVINKNGGSHVVQLELFLNELGRRPDDKIVFQFPQTILQFSRIWTNANVDNALTWLDWVKRPKYDLDGVWRRPNTISVTIANNNIGNYKITNMDVRIISRNSMNTQDRELAGKPNRAIVNLELTEANEIPTLNNSGFRW